MSSKEETLAMLLSMGFPADLCEKAVAVSENAQNVDRAAEWVIARIDAPSDAAPADAPQGGAVAPAGEAGQVSQGTAKSIVCSDCKKVFSDMVFAEAHAERTGHANFEESDQEKKPMTPEEKAAAIVAMQEKIKAAKIAREKKEKEEEREREIKRREQGKLASQSRQELEDAQRQRDLEARRKEKLEDARAKEKIKAEIERDRAERRAKFGGAGTAPAAPAPAAPAPTAAAPASASTTSSTNFTECVLQFKLTNGATIRNTFKPDDTLAAVKTFVERNRTDGKDPFTMMIPLPRQVFTAADMGRSLKDLGLCPRAQITLTKS